MAAGGDPLRAQEIEEKLTATWWYRWLDLRDAVIRYNEYAQKPIPWPLK